MENKVASYEPRILKDYKKAVPELMKELALKNIMEVPKIEKIVVNMGQGEAVQNIKVLENAIKDLEYITGQKPVTTKAKKSIATFKLRKGMPIGCMVTLRGARMYEFLDRLVNIAIPRIRDFRGYSMKSFDGRGNFSIGVREQIVFPEIDYDKVDKIRGVSISITTTAKNDVHAKGLLEKFNFPFRK
ncbi:MAG: 50S ribosomal protein L5 [Deltaproteobacteria bacterium]|nr:50S ribosomal protein L5 [Deltaproteobacteria bacterium]